MQKKHHVPILIQKSTNKNIFTIQKLVFIINGVYEDLLFKDGGSKCKH